MPEQLLNVLKICMLVLLYLFFLRVLRAVWAEVREPATEGAGRQSRAARRRAAAPPASATVPAPAPQPASVSPRAPAAPPSPPGGGAVTQLVVVEGGGTPGGAFRLEGETTIGRAPTCTIGVEDSYASAVHSRIFERDGAWFLEDLGSTNGTYLNRRKVSGPTQLSVGDRIAIGNCSWEVR